MKPGRLLLACLLALAPGSGMAFTGGSDTDHLPWSVRMAGSFMREHPAAIAYPDDPRSDKWTYEQGVVLEALHQLWRKTGDTTYFEYMRRNIDRFVGVDGRIRTYEYETFNLDNVPTGRQLLTLFRETRDPRYRAAADTLRKQLRNQPRTPSGGFWHKKIYPNQMWLDGLYMAEPFYAEYTKMFGDSSAWDDIGHQFELMEMHSRDSATGLLYHAWDESRLQRWADPSTGRSPNFWGRAMGWYAMALVDLLDFFPEEHQLRRNLVEILRRLADALVRYRDPSSGLWYQVVDQGTRAANYLESSASSMFVYTFAKGARRGYLDRKFYTMARESFSGLLKTMVTVDSSGRIDLHQACAGAGLGGNPYRDGSYEYYVNERRRTNDFKAIGPFVMAALQLEEGDPGSTPWRSCLDQPAEWYGGGEAVRIADNVLLYQCPGGGWPKNIDMGLALSKSEKAALEKDRAHRLSTIDNGATYTQMRYLARVYAATGRRPYADAFLRGLDFLFKAQYLNGGWPQFYPLRAGYYSHITFNDDAMVGVLNLLQDLVEKSGGFAFVDSVRREKAALAVQKGVDCILRCQVRIGGEPTVWCAQHDEQTFAPARARSFELPSLSGFESVGIVRFLMRLNHPSPAVVQSVQAAVQWFDRSRLMGLRVVTDSHGPYGSDRVIIGDSTAPPIWARFYDLKTNRPFYCGRDGVPHVRLEEISWERRNHYVWLGTWPTGLLGEDYPRWQKRWAPDHNVLGRTVSPVGTGRVVGLDCFYNSEWKTGKDGIRRRYHYTWDDTANSGFSILGSIVRGLGAATVHMAAGPTTESLQRLGVYVIVDPDTPQETEAPQYIEAPAADVIERWVSGGGVLVLMGNDRGNAEFEHLNRLAGRFGIQFTEDSHHRVVGTDFAAGTCEDLPPHPMFQGVRRIYLKEVSSLTIRDSAEAVLRENTRVLMAFSRYGRGMVFAVGDPWLYNEYIDDRKLPPGYDNARAGENLFRWLLGVSRQTVHGPAGE
jgi:unsaturated rhamnogalacturonyl hydrolase